MASSKVVSRRIQTAALGVFIFFMGAIVPARAESKLGGHFGFLLPLATHLDGNTTTIADQFSIGFPMGITLKKTEKVAFDLELMPMIHSDPQEVGLVVHPGVMWMLNHQTSAGIRMAFDLMDSAWGFTPMVARHFMMTEGTTFFTEVSLPIRIHEMDGNKKGSVGVELHFGVAF